jgi:glyoxylase-like metal-dependent hydrolase (beta-lactamase superfamily II)
MLYPDATLYVNKDEFAYWMNDENFSEGKKADLKPYIEKLKASLKPYLENAQYKLFGDGDEITPEIKAILLKGHSVGHTGFELTTDDKKILFWGDILHDAEIELSDMNLAFVLNDYDEVRASQATKKNIVHHVKKEREFVGGAHCPFPGIGHIVEKNNGYGWVPISIEK